MQKKSQAAIFIILGLVLLILVIMLINFKTGFLNALFKESSQEITSVPEQLKEVTDFIDKCLETTSRDSLYQLGRNGGYHKVPVETSIVWFDEEVPYYYLDKRILIPSLETVENELAKSISENIKVCLNFAEFEREGFLIEQKNYSVSSSIKDNEIIIKMEYPIKIEKGNLNIEIKEFETAIGSNMKNLILASEELIEIYSEKPGFICLNCIEEISLIYNVMISTTPVTDVTVLENNIIWFIVEDKEFTTEDEGGIFLRFVVEQ